MIPPHASIALRHCCVVYRTDWLAPWPSFMNRHLAPIAKWSFALLVLFVFGCGQNVRSDGNADRDFIATCEEANEANAACFTPPEQFDCAEEAEDLGSDECEQAFFDLFDCVIDSSCDDLMELGCPDASAAFFEFCLGLT